MPSSPRAEAGKRGPLPSLVLPPGGLRLGEYLLHKELGRGGMGVVYKALHRALKREVAVKLMLSELPEDRARFRREAESSAGLKHPYIVPVHDVRVEDGKLFFAMDFIEGKTLRQLVLEGDDLVNPITRSSAPVDAELERRRTDEALKRRRESREAKGLTP